MLIKLKLQNFRNYTDLEIDLGDKNILIGENAQGKTNILEAIYFLSSTKSFRTKDNFVFKNEEKFFTIEGVFEKQNIRIIEEKTGEFIKKTYQKKGAKVSARNILGEFYSVVFSPEDVSFFTDSPGVRRRQLDIILCEENKNYLEDLLKYKKILEQRNTLLKKIKEGREKKDSLIVWNEQLVETGIKVLKKREKFINFTNKNIGGFYERLSGQKENVEVFYKNSVAENFTNEIFLEKLKEKESWDIASGVTNIGPHRDDIIFLKNGLEIAPYGSRGEYRTAVLAFKFCEGNYFEKEKKAKVTYLLDDVFSELDKKRRTNLFSLIQNNPFIITATDRDHVDDEYLKKSKVFIVEKGKVREEN